MDFDRDIARRHTHASTWTAMPRRAGIDLDDGLPMWVADSEFATAPCVVEAMTRDVSHGAFGYGFDRDGCREAIARWMQMRRDWTIDPGWIVWSQGLGHAIATCIDVWSEPGEGVAYFTPVYHEFRLKTERAGRRPVPLPMALDDGRYVLDWDAAEAAITPDTRILLFCSPQNPSGRVWRRHEIQAVAEFAARHDLILVSDEVHADLVFPGVEFVATDLVAPDHRDRTVTLYAASKTFNLAGLRFGQMIIPDDTLRAKMAARMDALNYDPATLSATATIAALSPAGADWVDAQVAYLDANRQILDAGINAIPGLWSMPLEATFLAWIDFRGTGMEVDEIAARIRDDARIAVSPGPDFGPGGEGWNRMNFAMPRAMVEDAVARMQRAFGDLQ
ncbi:MAG: PatB family C-S lyase [Pseudomonadota bacterium]